MLRRSAKFTMLPVICLLLGAAPFQAKKWTLEATANPEIGPNMYIVEFPPELGGEVIEMSITSGSYAISLSTTRERATLTKWEQEVSAIEIMGMSTGPITISLQHDTIGRGFYDPDGGDDGRGFVELFAIFRIDFDDTELQEIGLTSPFIMPAFETGNIRDNGVLTLTANGEGDLLGYPLLFNCIATTKLKSIELN